MQIVQDRFPQSPAIQMDSLNKGTVKPRKIYCKAGLVLQ